MNEMEDYYVVHKIFSKLNFNYLNFFYISQFKREKKRKTFHIVMYSQKIIKKVRCSGRFWWNYGREKKMLEGILNEISIPDNAIKPLTKWVTRRQCQSSLVNSCTNSKLRRRKKIIEICPSEPQTIRFVIIFSTLLNN